MVVLITLFSLLYFKNLIQIYKILKEINRGGKLVFKVFKINLIKFCLYC